MRLWTQGGDMKWIFGLILISGIIACSSLPKKSRFPASSDVYQSQQHEYKLYSHTKYLPRKTQIFEQATTLKSTLKIAPKRSIDKGELLCTQTFSKRSNKTPIIQDINVKDSFDNDVTSEKIVCEYHGQSRNLEFLVQIDYAYHEPEKYEYNPEKEQEIRKELENINKLKEQLSQGKLNWEDLKKNDLVSKNSYVLSAKNESFKHFMSEDDVLKITGVSGKVTFKRSLLSYTVGPEGYHGKTSSNFMAANKPKYAFVCGKYLSNGLLAYDQYQQIKGEKGYVVCMINNSKKYTHEYTGKFEVKVELFESKKALEKIESLIADHQKQLEMYLTKKEKIIKEGTQSRHRYISKKQLPFHAQDKKFRDQEPPKYCTKKVEHESWKIQETKQSRVGKVGEFCGSPIEHKGRYYALCDGPNNGTEYMHGRLFVFDKKLKIIKRNMVMTDTERYPDGESIGRNRMLVPINLADKEYLVTSTFDGRLIYFDLDGNIKKQVKLNEMLLSDVVVFDNGNIGVLGTDDFLMRSKGYMALLNSEGDILKEDHSEHFSRYFDVMKFKNHLIYVTDKGEFRALDENMQEAKNVLVEKGRYLSRTAIYEDNLYVGSSSGRLYKIDWEANAVEFLTRIPHSGKTNFVIGSGHQVASRAISYAPVLFKDGSMAVYTNNDGRVHYLNSDFEYLFNSQVKYVRTGFNFGKIIYPDGSEGVMATSISYLNYLDHKGNKVGQWSNKGAENMTVAYKSGENHYLLGMYAGVFEYKFSPGEKTSTEKTFICE
jgi:hypothetical protein